jgi:sugar phosphate isomerase/epimerase
MEAIERYFCLGTLQWMSYPPAKYGYVEPVRRLAQDDFFGAIELGHIPDECERAQIRDILAASNMRVFHGAHPVQLGGGLNPNALDEAERIRAQRALFEAVDEAQFIGAEGMAFLAGKWSADTRESALEPLINTTIRVCDYAADKGIAVNLEVFDYDVDKAVLIGPPACGALCSGDYAKL